VSFHEGQTASVFLGEELERRDEKNFVSFSKVNRECAFNLTSEGDVTNFADTMIDKHKKSKKKMICVYIALH
jgi:hypothetical protein